MKSRKSKIILSILAIGICLMFLITSFSNILKEDIDNIGKVTTRHHGNGKLYSTTDEELINKYVSAMESAKYIRFIPLAAYAGSTSILLYNENNTKIASIGFNGTFVEINDKNYIIIGKKEKEFEIFYKEFYSDKNIVNE